MRLERAILRELLGNFLLASGTLVFVVAVAGLVKTMYEFAAVPLGTVLRASPYLVVGLLPHLLPMSLLVAVVVTFGRMAAEGEIGTIRGAGIHLGRVLAPALALGCAIAVGNQFLLDEGIPNLHFQRGAILRRVAQEAIANWSRGVPDLHFGPFYLRGVPTDRSGVFRDVLLVVDREEGKERRREAPGGESRPAAAPGVHDFRTVTARADEARLALEEGELVVELLRPRFVRTGEPGDPSAFFGVEEGKAIFRISLEELSKEPQQLKERDVSTAELLAALERGRTLPKREHRARYEVERRSALALAPLLFTLVGAPFGIFFRRGNRLFGFFLAFAIVLVGYYPVAVLSEHLADSKVLRPALAAYLGDGVLLAVGGIATARLFRV